MTLRITDDFRLRRIDGQCIVFFGMEERWLTLEQVRVAAEAFNAMAVMMTFNSCDENESEVLKLEDAA